ncbi:hypothetical protein DHODJN_13890 [Methylorubrum extorquens]
MPVSKCKWGQAPWCLLPVVTACVAGLIGPASAEDIKTRCSRNFTDNVTYSECISREANQDFANLKDKLCNGKTCLVRLTCKGGREDVVCSGSSFRVTYSFQNTNGTDITVIDPRGRKSAFFRCGTCTWLDYDTGPLKSLDIKGVDKGVIVLKIPQSEL